MWLRESGALGQDMGHDSYKLNSDAGMSPSLCTGPAAPIALAGEEKTGFFIILCVYWWVLWNFENLMLHFRGAELFRKRGSNILLIRDTGTWDWVWRGDWEGGDWDLESLEGQSRIGWARRLGLE